MQYETAFYAQLCADQVRSARGQRVVADQERTEEVLATEVVALTLSGVDEAAAGNVDDLVVQRGENRVRTPFWTLAGEADGMPKLTVVKV